MNRLAGLVLAGAGLATVISIGATADAAPAPVLFSVVEGRDATSDRPVLVLIGKSLTKLTSCVLIDPSGVRAMATPEVMLRSKVMVVLAMPADLAPGTYDLKCTYAKASTLTMPVRIANGAALPGAVSTASLAPDLKVDLDDATTFGGQTATFYRDASNVVAGTLDAARFSSIDDLVAEDSIGTGVAQVAAGDHDHDGRYFTQPVLGGAGTINLGSNPIDWTKLKGVPAGFADGADNDTTYAAGNGLSLASGTFAASFGGTGAANTVARSDHNHNATYLPLTGGVLTSGLAVTTSNTFGIVATTSSLQASAVWGMATAGTERGHGVHGVSEASGGFGVYGINSAGTGVVGVGAVAGLLGSTSGTSGIGTSGEATATTGSTRGVSGSSVSSSGSGVFGEATSSTGTTYGVFGKSSSTSGYGVYGEDNAGSGVTFGVYGKSTGSSGYGVFGEGNAGVKGTSPVAGGVGVFAESTLSTATPLVANNTAANPAASIAQFQVAGTPRQTFHGNGNVTITGTLTQNSDSRLKTDIAPLSETLRKIAAIRGVRYRMKDESAGPSGTHIGLLAQEVQAQFPELVRADEKGMLSVAYSSFSAVLVEAVKEQQEEIEAKDRRIDDLAKRVARLEALLAPAEPAKR